MRLKIGILFIGIGLTLIIGVGLYLYDVEPTITRDSLNSRDNSTRCAACHEELVSYWRRSGHSEIDCDVCHGPPGDHLIEAIDPRPRLLIKGPEHCLECHLRPEDEPESRPGTDYMEQHLKAIEKKHVTTIDRARVGGRCIFCHEPHLLE